MAFSSALGVMREHDEPAARAVVVNDADEVGAHLEDHARNLRLLRCLRFLRRLRCGGYDRFHGRLRGRHVGRRRLGRRCLGRKRLGRRRLGGLRYGRRGRLDDYGGGLDRLAGRSCVDLDRRCPSRWRGRRGIVFVGEEHLATIEDRVRLAGDVDEDGLVVDLEDLAEDDVAGVDGRTLARRPRLLLAPRFAPLGLLGRLRPFGFDCTAFALRGTRRARALAWGARLVALLAASAPTALLLACRVRTSRLARPLPLSGLGPAWRLVVPLVAVRLVAVPLVAVRLVPVRLVSVRLSRRGVRVRALGVRRGLGRRGRCSLPIARRVAGRGRITRRGRMPVRDVRRRVLRRRVRGTHGEEAREPSANRAAFPVNSRRSAPRRTRTRRGVTRPPHRRHRV